MSEVALRRTLALPADRRADLESIKVAIAAKTDTCAMNHAIKAAAYLATHHMALEDLQYAVWLVEQIEQRTQGGGRLFVQDPTEGRQIELVLPPRPKPDLPKLAA